MKFAYEMTGTPATHQQNALHETGGGGLCRLQVNNGGGLRPPTPAVLTCLPLKSRLQQTNLCSRQYVILGGDNKKLRANRARLQQTNLCSHQPVQQAVCHTWGR